MSLKALARKVLERNAPCNNTDNPALVDATVTATVSRDEPVELHDVEEWAALIEEGANVPCEWAEGFAKVLNAPAPRGVLARDWLATLDAAGHFIDKWAAQAQGLGWSASDLFGLDPGAPLARLDRRGVAFGLAGHQVLAITEREIITERDGKRMRLFKPNNPGPVAWEAMP